jgi:hypothetical protein
MFALFTACNVENKQVVEQWKETEIILLSQSENIKRKKKDEKDY